MTVTIADIVAVLLAFVLPALVGLSTGRAAYRGDFGKLFPSIIMGTASASGTGVLIAAAFKYFTGA